ncbi:MAG: amidohydrolase family protein [Bacteroidales bacterium]
MNRIGITQLLFSATLTIFLFSTSCKRAEYYSEQDFYSTPKIDAHVHISTTSDQLARLTDRYNLRLITLNTDSGDSLHCRSQWDTAIVLVKKFPLRIAYLACFHFDSLQWNNPSWEESVWQELEKNAAPGAVGVKLWKNIGMVHRDRDGSFIMISNDRFDNILNRIEKKGLVLTGHFGEPRNCWLPLDSMTVKNDREYFGEHPNYHMYLHPEYPSYEDQLRARDSMLIKHPGLKFVGCHLGSLEYDVDALARTLDRFPNMAVDMAARICHLQYQSAVDYDKVRNFILRYQDRLLYGTDQFYSGGLDSTSFEYNRTVLFSDWLYFTSEQEMQVAEVEKSFRGLHLPREVVDKIYFGNAKKWYGLNFRR